ncbi:MAG: DUF5131 family protein [Bacilli bacterium]|nr:DUF5131 family protein [Bacilli bacterium]
MKDDVMKYIKTCNPVVGCSIGCPSCGARKMNTRFKFIPNFSIPTLIEERLEKLYTKKGKIFVLTNMSDFCNWKDEWIKKIFEVIKNNPQNQYLILTKHPEKIKFQTELNNVWFGVNISNVKEKERIKHLRNNIKAKHYYISFNPLLEDIGILPLDQIEWILIGGNIKDNKKQNIVKKSWILNIVKKAKTKNIKVTMKYYLKDILECNQFIQELPIELERILKRHL